MLRQQGALHMNASTWSFITQTTREEDISYSGRMKIGWNQTPRPQWWPNLSTHSLSFIKRIVTATYQVLRLTFMSRPKYPYSIRNDGHIYLLHNLSGGSLRKCEDMKLTKRDYQFNSRSLLNKIVINFLNEFNEILRYIFRNFNVILKNFCRNSKRLSCVLL